MNPDLSIANEIFIAATENLDEKYFHLPIAGRMNPVYRERVYCYELYHLMRENLPKDYSYSLNGEVDKSGHTLIRGNWKPDFIFHKPGNMHDNLLVIEVKNTDADSKDIKKDLVKLTAFKNGKANYFAAYYLFYGNSKSAEKIISLCGELSKINKNIDLKHIDIYLHEQPGCPAKLISKSNQILDICS